MLRIRPSVIHNNGIYRYDTLLKFNKKRFEPFGKTFDLTKQYQGLDVTTTSLKINEIKADQRFAKNFYSFLNHANNNGKLCQLFAYYVLPPQKTQIRWINAAQLDSLRLYDKVILYGLKNDVMEIPLHIAIYIGRHFNNTRHEEYLFMSKLGELGIYVNNLSQLLTLYEANPGIIKIERTL